MTLIFIDSTVMLRSGFATVSVLFFIRIFCVYMVENGVFGILYVILLRKEVAAALCTVFFMVIFYWVYERLNWGSDEGIWQTLNLMKDLRVTVRFTRTADWTCSRMAWQRSSIFCGWDCCIWISVDF